MVSIEFGLDFLLSHFGSKFPRTISTFKTHNRQIEVFSKEEALKYFRESDLIDCRVSGFGRDEIEQEKPNLIFVDLDDKSALNETRSLFYKTISAIPTVLHTGNGYAIIQPINMIPLKRVIHNYRTIDDIPKKFLQFAERYLTNSKCDSGNHPSLKSCLIRVPGSYNSKLLDNRNYEQSRVIIVQEWNHSRAVVQSLPFKKYLDRIEKQNQKRQNRTCNFFGKIPYIEKLLQSKLNDGRKRIFALVLCPYLINVKKLSIEESTTILLKFFDDYIPKSVIEYELKRVMKKGILPYSLFNMKENDPMLYQIVTTIAKNTKEQILNA